MKNNAFYFLVALVALLTACGADGVEQKKAQLMKHKEELHELKIKINQLEKELTEIDPEYAKEQDKSTLVTVLNLTEKPFAHFMDVRGTVESRKNVTLSAETMGRILKINVKEGDYVQVGQTLLIIDAEVIRKNIEELKTALELAETVYAKQANLWKNNIGTEIQYLQAKNNKESLERRLATAYSQLQLATVKAPFSGHVDKVLVKEGEMASPGFPLFRIVSLQDMYVQADVSERYIGKFRKGDSVGIIFPSLNKELSSQIYSLSQVIDQQNRTFSVEVSLPGEGNLFRPNQLSVLRMRDYSNPNALVVPSEIIQKDNHGEYVFVAEKNGEKLVAKKRHIKRGVSYNNETEVLDGLTSNDKVIFKGYRNVSDGVAIKIAG